MPGIVLENKGSGIALHYRLAPELQGDLLLALQNLLPRHNRQFTICGGRKVIEVLPVGFSKGRALHQMASLPSFANRIPVMIGDDIADQDAFVAAKELNGFGLKVAGENLPAAVADFDSPAEVLAWLARILQLGTESRASGIRSLRTSN
jgi:trehalose 6-phosphate phosphatase